MHICMYIHFLHPPLLRRVPTLMSLSRTCNGPCADHHMAILPYWWAVYSSVHWMHYWIFDLLSSTCLD